MKKLTLDLDELAVDSFDTSLPARGEGTVRGHDSTESNYWSCMSVCPTVSGRCCPP